LQTNIFRLRNKHTGETYDGFSFLATIGFIFRYGLVTKMEWVRTETLAIFIGLFLAVVVTSIKCWDAQH